jgi:3-deoxy-D-manno-octulosonate 8-phosphate phosphatase (KDO 8-P phosphatase)
VLAQKAGVRVGLLSARQSASTTERANQLRITIVRQGALDKLTTYEALCAELGLDDRDVAFMGDDLLDLPILARVGLAAAPADAVPEVKAIVHWVSHARGGDGAVRELAEMVLKSQDRWDALVAEWTPAPTES